MSMSTLFGSKMMRGKPLPLVSLSQAISPHRNESRASSKESKRKKGKMENGKKEKKKKKSDGTCINDMNA
jgi:hypothetical protein